MRLALRALLLASLLFFSAHATFAKDDDAQNAAPLIMSIWDESHREYPKSRAISLEIEGVELDGWVAGPEILIELGNDKRLARIDAVIRAPSCDFELDVSQGPNLLLPHMKPATTAARMLLAKARLHIEAGEYDVAVEAIRGVFVINRHLEADHSLLAVLVRARQATTAVHVALRVPPEQWMVLDTGPLLAELRRLPAVDPFGIRRAMTLETEIFSDWVITNSQTVEGCDRIWDNLDKLVFIDGEDVAPSRWELGPVVAQYGGLERAGQAFRIAGAHQAAALDQNDPFAALERIAEQVDAGEYGPLAPYFVPYVDRAVLKVRQAEPTLELLRIILRGMRDTPAAPLPKP